MRKIAKLTALIALASIVIGCNGVTADKQEKPSYVTKRVVAESRTLTMPYPATIRGKRDVEILPQVSGKITRVLIEEGQTVKRGQLMFVIESAKAQLSLRRAELEEARNNLSYTEIRSPADGVVDVLPFREGALVSPSMSQPLTTVSDNATMYAYFSLTENQMLTMVREYGSKHNAVGKLPQVELQLGDNSIYKVKGDIETISGMIDKQTGTMSARAAFPNTDGLLHSGGSANVLVSTIYEKCIVVPRAATYEIQHLTYVYRIVGGKAKATVVEVERANASEFIVHNGLYVGDSIVTEGIRSLHDGMEI